MYDAAAGTGKIESEQVQESRDSRIYVTTKNAGK